MSNFTIRNMQQSDSSQVLNIYQEGINTDNASFLERAPNWKNFDNNHLNQPRLIAHTNESIIGWAALSLIQTTGQFGGVCEVSIYITTQHRNKGVGSLLLSSLVLLSEKHKIWTLEANIFPENIPSILLHKKYGFCIVGTRQKISMMKKGIYKGKWRDVTLMERRSEIVGI